MFENIEVKKLMPCKENREIEKKGPIWESFLESIKTLGIQVPLIVRIEGDGYEVVAGHRRLAAAKALKLETVPCDVRAIEREEAMEIRIVENLQRKDLTPFEEAHQVAHLMELADGNLDEAAAKLGKSVSWVYQRARIATLPKDLAAKVKAWPIGSLVELAKLPDEERPLLVEAFTQYEDQDVDPRSIMRWVEGRRHALKAAPWKKDADLKPCKCCDCPKRTGANKELFELNPQEADKNDMCLDPSCWKGKIIQIVEIEKTKHPDLMLVSNAWDNCEITIAEQKVTVLGRCGWHGPFAGDKKIITALNFDTGKRMKIALNKPDKPDKAKEKGKVLNPETGKLEVPMKERRAMLERRRVFDVLQKLHEAFWKTNERPQAVSVPVILDLVRMAGASQGAYLDKVKKEHLTAGLGELPEADVLQIIWLRLRNPLEDHFKVHQPGQVTEKQIAFGKMLASLIGFNWDEAMVKAVADKPEPKSWKK